MSLQRRIFEALTGIQTYAAATNYKGMVSRLVGEFKSKSAVARFIGVSEAAIRRWEKGATPRNPRELTLAYRRVALSKGKEAHARAGHIRLDFQQAGRGGAGQRNRTVDEKSLQLAPGTMDKVVDAYLRGDDAGAADALRGGTRERWYAANMPDDDGGGDDDYPLL